MHEKKIAFVGFLIAITITFSISQFYRIEFAGLYVHPYLLAVPLFALLFSIQLHKLELKLFITIMAFSIIFFLINLSDKNPFIEPLKVISAFITFIFFAKTVKDLKDVEIVGFGLLLCALAISIKTVYESFNEDNSRLAGIYVFEGIGNKNSQSLYTLPGMFFNAYFLGRSIKSNKQFLMIFYIASFLTMILSSALTANRSGWVGIIVIMIFWLVWNKFSIKGIIIYCIIFGLSYHLILLYAEDIVSHKIEVTQEGYVSDAGRVSLIKEAILIGFENPIFGLGKDEFHQLLARRLKLSYAETVDSHNLLGYLFGAGGMFSLFFFLRFLYNIIYGSSTLIVFREQKEAKQLLLFFVILFLIRSFFTREILYSPTFFAGFGILYGYLESFNTRIRLLVNGR